MIKERNGGYIVVDAMDECTEVSKVLDWLSAFSDKLWILVTSKIQADGVGKSVLQFKLGGKESHIDEDIAMYLESEIDMHSNFEGEVQSNIKETLKRGAHGVFHWAECQLRAVQKCSTGRSVRKVLNKLPRDLEKTYEQALKKCQEEEENSEEAQHLLLWLLYAYEPLTTKHINAIMAADLEEQVIDHHHMEVQVEKVIDSTSVTVGQSNIVQLAHASVKDYLIMYSQAKHTKDLFELNEQLAHDIMTQTTIIYIMQKEDIPYKKTPFGIYAVKNWLSHASKVEAYKVKGKAQSLIQTMLIDKDVYFARWQKRSLGYKHTWEISTQATPLYYGALHGLYEVIQKLISFADVDVSGGAYGTPLQAASFKGHEHIVKLLLKNGAKVNAQGDRYGNALQAASLQRHEDIVKLLLENGADVNAQRGVFENALQAASSQGHEPIVKLLLEMGANINGNAVQAALSQEHEHIVKLLLEKGADVNAQGGWYGTALQTASLRGNEPTVKLLLEMGAKVNAQGGEYGNALQAASFGGHEPIVRLLLETVTRIN
ncbi:ankyrin repeat-containing domain protein, partial [Lentinula edodes]